MPPLLDMKTVMDGTRKLTAWQSTFLKRVDAG
jgi:hypothetical protein